MKLLNHFYAAIALGIEAIEFLARGPRDLFRVLGAHQAAGAFFHQGL